MSHSATCTSCGLQDESFIHCIQDCATGSHALIFSAGVWWSWQHRNLMCLQNETWSLSRLSFSIRAMVETFKNYFSPASNEALVERYIKWNHKNYSCVILNVDESCLDSPIRSGFGGIIRNTFGHYIAEFSSFIYGSSDILFVELYAIYKGFLLAKEMSIDELVCYSNSLHCINPIKGPDVKYHIHVVLIQDVGVLHVGLILQKHVQARCWTRCRSMWVQHLSCRRTPLNKGLLGGWTKIYFPEDAMPFMETSDSFHYMCAGLCKRTAED
ncbi:hypothetical protein TSUD_327290 [Trifolium subterraneum]|uniref:RNase H type-1 domain-containing protein n=1 Tax=Trifolium subterraneum TaxID=3900 RepID=A0A2Z6NEL8_TRISU|nr:hypothetical protein TSUD_327290 [Trifolium subterraneum]